jgi:dTDP-4-dehydrorhamnose reductase
MSSGVTPRILILGSSGQVGALVARELERHRIGAIVRAARSGGESEMRFDLRRPQTISRIVSNAKPTDVVLAAAATNVTWCEEHPDESRLVNVTGTMAVAEAAESAGARLTFISTDYVFDGLQGPYRESDPPNPINVYGRDKLDAERSVLSAESRNLVVRTCQVFGWDHRRMNFVLQVVDRLRRGERVEAADNLIGTPTYGPDLARSLVHLVLDDARGVWHVAGSTVLSRYDFARRIARSFSLDPNQVTRVIYDPQRDIVSRPEHAGLVTEHVGRSTLRPTPLGDALDSLAASEAN